MSTPDPSPKRGPQWANSYEAQLSATELHWLHVALLARKPSDKAIIAKMPPWRDGKRKGEPVSGATLTSIRKRLEMEITLAANEATVDSVLQAEQDANPDITQEELDRMGLRMFTTLAIREQNTDNFVALLRSKKDREVVALDKARFRRETCTLFLEWFADQRAKDIAASTSTNAQKIDQLGSLMFGEDWNTEEKKA